MRSCPTLNNNITTNNYKTMMEEAPNATNHDDASKRRASSYSYDLPNQEPNQDGDVSLVPPDILTITDIINQDNEDGNSVITAFISEIAPSYLNTINKMITYINEDYTMYFNKWEDDLPEQ